MSDEALIQPSAAETPAAHYEQAVRDALAAALELQITRLRAELAELRAPRSTGRVPSAGQLHARPGEPVARPTAYAGNRNTAAA